MEVGEDLNTGHRLTNDDLQKKVPSVKLRAFVFVLMGSFGPKGSDLKPFFKRSTLLQAA